MLRTRLDGRSEKNDTILLIDADGNIIGRVTVANNVKVELEIETDPSIHIAKANGWTSK
jgi:hypothetical protein